MNTKLLSLLLFAGLLGGSLLLSCADDDDDDPAPPPRVVGVWDSQPASEDSHGVNQISYYFYSDYTYRYFLDAPPVVDERGSWNFSGLDSIEFHATWRDSMTIDENYTWRYDIVEGATQASDVLHLWIYVEPLIGPAYYLETLFDRTQ